MKFKDQQLLEEAYAQVILTELFDNPYSNIETGEQGETDLGQSFDFTFETDSGKPVEVIFILTSPKSIEVGFTVDGTDAATGEGGEETYRILATVMKIITQVMSNPISYYDEDRGGYINITKKIDTFVWAARMKEQSRVRLYDRGAKRLEGLLNDLASKKGTLKPGEKWTHTPSLDYVHDDMKKYFLVKNQSVVKRVEQEKSQEQEREQRLDAGKLKDIFLYGNKEVQRHSPEIFAKLPDKFKLELLADPNLTLIPPGIIGNLSPEIRTGILQNKEMIGKITEAFNLTSSEESTLRQTLTDYLQETFKRKMTRRLEAIYMYNYKPRKDNMNVQKISNEVISQILQTSKVPTSFAHLNIPALKKSSNK